MSISNNAACCMFARCSQRLHREHEAGTRLMATLREIPGSQLAGMLMLRSTMAGNKPI